MGNAEGVYVELERWDGSPIRGIADFRGRPHYFARCWDDSKDRYGDLFALWSISDQDLALEIESWAIFVSWNDDYVGGTASTSTHPATGGIDARCDHLEMQLADARQVPPEHVLAAAEVERLEDARRYTLDGLDYRIRWAVVDR